MKTKVDIITGFLGSGKTSFINSILENNYFEDEKIVVLQCESGEIDIDSKVIEDYSIIIIKSGIEKSLDSEFIKDIVKEYSPDRIIIEYNGMLKLEDLITIIEDRTIAKLCRTNMIINIIDVSTFGIYFNNMGDILREQISSSDLIILSNIAGIEKSKLNNARKIVKTINKSAKIVEAKSQDAIESALNEGKIKIDRFNPLSKYLGLSNILYAAFFTFVIFYFGFVLLNSINFEMSSFDLSKLQLFSTVFISLLIQAFPFILIGAFISSIIQILISKEVIARFFPKNVILASLAAVVAGFFFPVCDCATVPVARGLLKKGIPISAVITFMLSAPIVNPVVIASTLYAFPGSPMVTFYRVYLGTIIAIFVGFLFLIFPEKDVLLPTISNLACQCGCCGENNVKDLNIFEKIKGMFKHAGTEFFNVGKFLIIGAFLSSILQVFIPQSILASFAKGDVSSLLIMMLAAFVLSVCSTSDAFIARSFLNQFSIGPVMGFMVLGPMIDIKNTTMLFGSFNKRFVIKLLFVVVGISFGILLIIL